MPLIRKPIYDQSAVIPWRRTRGRIEVLLVISSSGKRWVVPKGLVEPDLTRPASAEAEAFEEAGVRGSVSPDVLGSYDYEKWGGVCRVRVFLMRVEHVLDNWPEPHRERRWLAPCEAAHMVREPDLARMLRSVPALAAELFPSSEERNPQ